MKHYFHILRLIAAAITAAACASAGSGTATTASTTKLNPNLITTAEIDGTANLRDAYQTVQRLRPTWLTRAKTEGISMSGTTVGGSGSRPTASGVDASSVGGNVLVYLDNSRMGGLSALADIPVSAISTIQWMDPATATALLPGLSSYAIAGAIVVHSRTGR